MRELTNWCNTKKVALVLGCAALALLSGCSKESSDQKQDSSKEKSAKTLHLYLQTEPMSMDPGKAGNRISQIVTRELFEGLMRIDNQGRPSFALAKTVEESDDKCVYRFHLRPSVWSNGMPVTAHDFVYAWKRNIHPDSPTAYSYAFFCIKNAQKARLGQVSLDEVGVQADDDFTLTVTLEHPAPYFIELTSNPLYSPVCKAIVEKNPGWNNEMGPNFVSNGPFTLSEWKHQAEIVLSKNPNYWDPTAVSVDMMTFPIITDPLTALNMFEVGDLDWVGDPFGSIPLEAIPRLKAQKKLEVHSIGGVKWLELNTKHPLLQSRKIRQAMAMAINRSDIVEHLLQGGEKPAYSLLPETLTLAERPLFKDYDIDRAKGLFDEGVKELNLSLDDMPLITFSHYAEPFDKAVAEAIQQQWQQAFGLKINLSPADRTTHLSRIASGDFDVGDVNWFTFYHDPIYNLEFIKYANSSFNGTKWENPRYTQLLDLSDVEPNLAVRDEILREAEELLINEMPVIPICYNTCKFAKNPEVYGESFSPIGMFELKKIDVDSGIILVNK